MMLKIGKKDLISSTGTWNHPGRKVISAKRSFPDFVVRPVSYRMIRRFIWSPVRLFNRRNICANISTKKIEIPAEGRTLRNYRLSDDTSEVLQKSSVALLQDALR